MKTKLLSLMLLASLLLTFLASCGGGTAAPAGTTAAGETAAVTEGAAAETTAAKVSYLDANLPDVKYDGYTFRFIQTDPATNYDNPWWKIVVSEINGDVLNDAIYTRNKTIEEAFGVTFAVTYYANDSTTLSSAKKSISAGDDAFDATHMSFAGSNSLVQEGMLVDLYTVDNLDLTRSWWDQNLTESLEVNGKMMYATGDISPMMNIRCYAMVINKDMCAELGMEAPYQIVRDGQWTAERFTGYVKGVNQDMNGDGQMDYEDRWGFFSENYTSTMMYVSFGGRIIEPDGKGSMVYTAESEKNVGRMTRALALIIDKETTLWANPLVAKNGNSWKAASEWYAAGNALIRSASFETVPRDYRTMESDFGVLPFPKYDETQDEYITTASDSGYVVAIPVTVSDAGRSGLILEALAAESVNTVTTALYDVCLNGKYVRDEESAEMIDIIFNGKVYELGYMLDLGSFRSMLKNLETAYSTDVVSTLAANQTKITDALAKYLAAFGK